jgi:SAM-dependent methyltransferase
MATIDPGHEQAIINREEDLREWFTHGKDELMREVDGIDIGWGGSQRWATSNMSDMVSGRHLDFACGYGTFLAQIGWRFPRASLFGLNIDYRGPHACIRRLLDKAGVRVALVQADACAMPFPVGCFSSISCFLGLQDMKIGFGEESLRTAVSEAVRVLKPGGYLILLDELAFDFLLTLVENECVEVVLQDEYVPDIKWRRPVAEAAIKVYSECWTAQSRAKDVAKRDSVHRETYQRMKADMEQQLGNKGFYVPHGTVRMVVVRKI